GVPVLTSRGGGLGEVAGEAAELVDPLDIGAMAQSLRRLAGDADWRGELSRRGPAQAAKFAPEAYRVRLAESYRRAGVRLG
ncbi:MAG TPA: glycosyltransferase family 1 protein, partial [Acetobacteraceae bacterium]|nr:glycosyltransferase family 1 protein [Acetobacteraceae bacterium]